MNPQDRLAAALNRIVAATGARRSQASDAERSERDGTERAARLDAAIVRLEIVADDLEALTLPTSLRRVA